MHYHLHKKQCSLRPYASDRKMWGVCLIVQWERIKYYLNKIINAQVRAVSPLFAEGGGVREEITFEIHKDFFFKLCINTVFSGNGISSHFVTDSTKPCTSWTASARSCLCSNRNSCSVRFLESTAQKDKRIIITQEKNYDKNISNLTQPRLTFPKPVNFK